MKAKGFSQFLEVKVLCRVLNPLVHNFLRVLNLSISIDSNSSDLSLETSLLGSWILFRCLPWDRWPVLVPIRFNSYAEYLPSVDLFYTRLLAHLISSWGWGNTQTFHQIECRVEVARLYVRVLSLVYRISLQDEVCEIVP